MSDPLPSKSLYLDRHAHEEQILSAFTESFLSLKELILDREINSQEYQFFRNMMDACLEYFEQTTKTGEL